MEERRKNVPTSIAVRAIITNGENKVLLTKRNPADYEGGKWCLPGGKPNKDEDVALAAERELREEVGLQTALTYYKEIENPNTSTGSRWVTHYFIGLSDVIPTDLQEEEISEVGYFSKDEVEQLDIAFDHKMVLTEFFNQPS